LGQREKVQLVFTTLRHSVSEYSGYSRFGYDIWLIYNKAHLYTYGPVEFNDSVKGRAGKQFDPFMCDPNPPPANTVRAFKHRRWPVTPVMSFRAQPPPLLLTAPALPPWLAPVPRALWGRWKLAHEVRCSRRAHAFSSHPMQSADPFGGFTDHEYLCKNGCGIDKLREGPRDRRCVHALDRSRPSRQICTHCWLETTKEDTLGLQESARGLVSRRSACLNSPAGHTWRECDPCTACKQAVPVTLQQAERPKEKPQYWGQISGN
jgi:hypothetical protein